MIEKLTVRYENVQKGVDKIMCGYILHTRTDDIIEQGISQGHKEDAIRMNEDGLSPEKIAQYVGEDISTVKEWLSSSLALA